MPSRIVHSLLVAALATWPGVHALAEKAACEVNYLQEGGFLAVCRFTTWGVVAGVGTNDACSRIYREELKSGLTVASADRELGAIAFRQANAGVTDTGQSVDVPWNVTIEADPAGAKATVSKTTPGGYATHRDFQIRSMCAVIDAARPWGAPDRARQRGRRRGSGIPWAAPASGRPASCTAPLEWASGIRSPGRSGVRHRHALTLAPLDRNLPCDLGEASPVRVGTRHGCAPAPSRNACRHRVP